MVVLRHQLQDGECDSGTATMELDGPGAGARHHDDCFWRDQRIDVITRRDTSTSETKSSGASACSTARSPCLVRGRRGAAADRDHAAPGRQVQRARMVFVSRWTALSRGLRARSPEIEARLKARPVCRGAAARKRTSAASSTFAASRLSSGTTGAKNEGPTSRRSRPTSKQLPSAARESASSHRRGRRGAAREVPRGPADQRGRGPRGDPQGHARDEDRAGHLRHGVQERGHSAATRLGHRAICRRRSTSQPSRESIPDNGAKETRPAEDKAPFAALAFGVTDPYVGTLTFFPRHLGTLKTGSYVLNATKGEEGADQQ